MTSRNAPQIFVQVVDRSGNTERVTDESARILGIEYLDSDRRADKLTVTVSNQDLRNFDDQIWAHGNKVRASWGYPGNMAPQRECVIVKVLGFTQLRVECRALSVLMDLESKRRVFEGMTRAQVAQQVANENGWKGEFVHIEDTQAILPFITQAGLTDAQFMARLAHQQGFQFYVDHEGFHFHERQFGARPVRALTWYGGRGEMLDVSVETDVTRRPGRVKVKSKDSDSKTEETKQADNDSDPNRAGTAQVLLSKSDDLTTAGLLMSYEAPATQPPEAAEREAKVKYRRAQRATAKLTLDLVGDPSFLAKEVIKLQNIGTRLSGLYYVAEVAHRVGQGGYSMKAKVQSDGTGEARKLSETTTSSGLPEAVPEKSKAKRKGDTVAEGGQSGSLDEPGGTVAVPVPVFDADGNQVGTTYKYVVKEPPVVTIRDGSLSSGS